MDVSPEYIKMCDCEEIQGQMVKGYNGEYGFWDTTIYLGDYYAELLHGKWYTDWYDNECGLNNQAEMVIWLPRQDQLQAMLFGTGIIAGGMIDGVLAKFVEEMFEFFDEHMVNPIYSYCTSMEQLWLAYCLKELYNKVWNGTNWVKQSIK